LVAGGRFFVGWEEREQKGKTMDKQVTSCG